MLPRSVLAQACAIPYAIEGNRLKVAVADPTNVQADRRAQARHAVSDRAGGRGPGGNRGRAAPHLARQRGVGAHGAARGRGDARTSRATTTSRPTTASPTRRSSSSSTRSSIQAADDGASDIHFDPSARRARRADAGRRHPARPAAHSRSGWPPPSTTRLKVLAKLDIAERRRPQDGRISLSAKVANRALDIRVAVLPTVEGEAVVLRLLDKSKRPPTLTELGFADDMRAAIEAHHAPAHGRAARHRPNRLGQVDDALRRPQRDQPARDQHHHRRGPGRVPACRASTRFRSTRRRSSTFATALRTILRSDPDVIMVGEIRDVETAKISIESALTGHFVLSTLHTNDAPSALTRLNEMGVEPFLTGAAVTAVLAQRLARRLCAHCCEAYTPTQRGASRRPASRRSRSRPPTGRRSTARAAARAAARRATRAASASSSYGHERGDRAARSQQGEPRRDRARGGAPAACVASGTTASRRSCRA